MNLLVIAPHYKYFIKNQVEALAQYFSEIHVAIRYNPLTELSPLIQFWSKSEHFKKYSKKNLVDFTNLPENVKIHLIPIYYFIPDGSNKSTGNKVFKKMVKWIDKEKINFDLIHAHFTWPTGYAGARLKEESGIPFVVTAHGYDIYSLPFKDRDWREKIEYVLNMADHIITVSQSNLACIKQLDVSAPVTVIPNGFRSDMFYLRDSSECRNILNLPQDKKIILTVGNLEPVKAHTLLIDAITEIITERKNILCVIVGAGRLRTMLERKIRSLGLEDYIIVSGGKPHHEIPLWMNVADLFVLPSLNEGNPTVMFEALGCGLPFVGTRVGGVPEIITSEDYGLLVEPSNADDLAEKLLIALDKEWDREKIRRYAKQFTWEKIAKEIFNVYEKAMK